MHQYFRPPVVLAVIVLILVIAIFAAHLFVPFLIGTYSTLYMVVLFEDTQEVAAVPKSWARKDTCWWPALLKGSALKRAVERRSPPTDGWKLYNNVTVLREAGDTIF